MSEDVSPAIANDQPPEERALVELLSARRPLAAPAFRGRLSRRIAALNPGYGPRPARLWLTAAAWGAAGAALLLAGAVAGGIL